MQRILLLGAGYANIALIKSLPILQDTHITLVSKNPYHYTSVLLHEVASGVKDKEVLFDLKDMFDADITIKQDSIIEIKEGKAIGQSQTYEYDILVIGLGFSSDTFGIKGVKEFSMPLVDYQNALHIKEKIRNNIIEYKATKDPTKLHIVVCGGGFSGSELVASLAEELPKICAQEGVDSSLLRISCIEALPNVLPMFSEKLIQAGSRYMQKNLNIHLLTHCKILECKENEVIIQRNDSQESIRAGAIIWTAGVKGNEVIEHSSFFVSHRSKIQVDTSLHPIGQKIDMDNIFVIGDCAALLDPSTKRFYPPTAQLAIAEGEFVAKALIARIQNREFSETFSYTSKGTFCSLGARYAIGESGTKSFKGKLAIAIKRYIEMKWRYKIGGIAALLRPNTY